MYTKQYTKHITAIATCCCAMLIHTICAAQPSSKSQDILKPITFQSIFSTHAYNTSLLGQILDTTGQTGPITRDDELRNEYGLLHYIHADFHHMHLNLIKNIHLYLNAQVEESPQKKWSTILNTAFDTFDDKSNADAILLLLNQVRYDFDRNYTMISDPSLTSFKSYDVYIKHVLHVAVTPESAHAEIKRSTTFQRITEDERTDALTLHAPWIFENNIQDESLLGAVWRSRIETALVKIGVELDYIRGEQVQKGELWNEIDTAGILYELVQACTLTDKPASDIQQAQSWAWVKPLLAGKTDMGILPAHIVRELVISIGDGKALSQNRAEQIAKSLHQAVYEIDSRPIIVKDKLSVYTHIANIPKPVPPLRHFLEHSRPLQHPPYTPSLH